MNVTLNKIREQLPCSERLAKLLSHLGKTNADDEPLSIITILESNGLDDALLCLRAVDGHDKEIRLFAVWCARQVQHLMTDQRSISALDVAERFASGIATRYELDHARDAALAASGAAARAARDAALDASWAAWAAARAAALAASWAARAAAWDAAWAAARAAMLDAAWDASWAARAAAWAAARAAQEKELREICASRS